MPALSEPQDSLRDQLDALHRLAVEHDLPAAATWLTRQLEIADACDSRVDVPCETCAAPIGVPCQCATTCPPPDHRSKEIHGC